jgi:hypothetical protein
MGKSIRSKTKRAYRHKKREDSDFAVTAAARLARLSAKLANAAGVRGEADAEEPAADDAPVDGEGAETTVTDQGVFLFVYAPSLPLHSRPRSRAQPCLRSSPYRYPQLLTLSSPRSRRRHGRRRLNKGHCLYPRAP